MGLILFSLTPSHSRPQPTFAFPILTTLPALTETQLLWIGVGAAGGAGVVLGAQGISNMAQVFFIGGKMPQNAMKKPLSPPYLLSEDPKKKCNLL